MEADIRVENKELVKRIVERFPRGTRYAEKVAKSLQEKGHKVTSAMVSQTTGGSTYSPLIIQEIIAFSKLYQEESAKLNESLKEAVESQLCKQLF